MRLERGWTSRPGAAVRWFAVSLLAASIGVSGAPADEGKRVALVIGNDAYSAGPLKNAVNDARAIDKALRAAGFSSRLLENATKEQMDDALGAFADSLGPEHKALFYYAGHAFQIENENFLVPVDFKPARGVTQSKNRCVSLSQLLEELRRARAKTRVVILDSCRSNPLAGSYGLTAGLAQPLNAGKDTYIAYSTSPNQVAEDAPDATNSWFTEALAELISGPALDIDEIFNRVRKRVQTATEGRQTPWSQSSLTASFYFRSPLNAELDSDPSVAQKWMDLARLREQREDWPQAIDLVNRVLAKKPGATLEAAAKSKLAYLTARREAQTAFEGADYGNAARLYQKAFEADRFSSGAALQAANSYLLADRISDAVPVLKSIRVRGTTESIEKVNSMLQELAKVSDDAKRELNAEIPKPPPVEELFADIRFGVPDWDAGDRYVRGTPVDLSRWVKELEASAAPLVLKAPGASSAAVPLTPTTAATPGGAAAGAEPATVSPAAPSAGSPGIAASPAPPAGAEPSDFQVQIVALEGTRELDYGDMVESSGAGKASGSKPPRPKPAAKAAEPGVVVIEGLSGGATVLVNGKPPTGDSPGRLQLPPGSYEIRILRGGQIVNRQKVDVKSAAMTRLVVRP